jgi:AraC family transcriptional regulator, transcriptional activator of pobA
MQRDNIQTVRINSIAECHAAMGIDKPRHPLFSILRFEDLPKLRTDTRVRLIFDLYQIVLKKDCPGKLQYGQTKYDFDEGVMGFFAPKQINILEEGEIMSNKGWLLAIHPDFMRSYPLGQKIKEYGFFEYALDEALILSEEEEQSVIHIFKAIEKEYLLPIDNFSQDVVVSNIDLLLTYSNRYYNRQFILRKPNNNSLYSNFLELLNKYLEHEVAEHGLPTVKYFADQLYISANYLSDMLRQLTGQSALQHIHASLIDKAKEYLSTTELSVSEIAYALGFEYPQSFSKLFKTKTSISPGQFRESFN